MRSRCRRSSRRSCRRSAPVHRPKFRPTKRCARSKPRPPSWNRSAVAAGNVSRMDAKPRFTKPERELDLPKLEEELLARWQADGTRQSVIDRREGRPTFVFYEG